MTGILRFPEPAALAKKSGPNNVLTRPGGRPCWSAVEVIVYSLRCKNGHEFEGWFRDSASFDSQSCDGTLSCPTCNSRRVEKAIMAPSLAANRNAETVSRDTASTRQFMTGL